MRRDPFQAIADPTRREIIRIISKKSLNLNAIADSFNISRPAISKQIKILYECGLITIRTQGRERFCEANLHSLQQVSHWLDPYRVFWNAKLDDLENFLERPAPKSSSKNKKVNSVNHPSILKTKRK